MEAKGDLDGALTMYHKTLAEEEKVYGDNSLKYRSEGKSMINCSIPIDKQLNYILKYSYP